MSENKSTGTGNGQGAFGAAKDAVTSAAEQVRATAPGAYDAGTKAAQYIGETASEHPVPVLVGIAALAFIGGLVANLGSARNSRDWEQQSRDWLDRGQRMSGRVRSAAPSVSDAATDAGDYVARNVRDNPLSGVLIAAAIGGVLGYLLHGRD